MAKETVYVKRLRSVRSIVSKTAARYINMYAYSGVHTFRKTECGCALHHYQAHRGEKFSNTPFGDYFDMDQDQVQHVFNEDISIRGYGAGTGVVAKREFLRRIDEVIAEKTKAA